MQLPSGFHSRRAVESAHAQLKPSSKYSPWLSLLT